MRIHERIGRRVSICELDGSGRQRYHYGVENLKGIVIGMFELDEAGKIGAQAMADQNPGSVVKPFEFGKFYTNIEGDTRRHGFQDGLHSREERSEYYRGGFKTDPRIWMD